MEDKWIFPRNAAKNIVFNGQDLEDNWRDDLYPNFPEWKQEVQKFVPQWQLFKARLEMQSYKKGDFVVAAASNPKDGNATILFFGQIQEMKEGQGRATFKTFDGDGDCQRSLKDCIILNQDQAERMQNISKFESDDIPSEWYLTSDELGLPEFKAI